MNLLQPLFLNRVPTKNKFPISSVKLRGAIVATLLLAATASAQTTYTFNPNYPAIPGDTEPRTFRWDDFRNWGGSIPGANDTAIVTNTSELVGSFQVGSVRLNTASVIGAGALEVLGNLQIDGPVSFFPSVTLRGTSQWGILDPENTAAAFYSNVENYGNAIISGTRANAVAMIGYNGSQPVFSNRTGASLTFGNIDFGGIYSGFVNEAGATLTKAGTGDAVLTASLLLQTGSFRPAFEQHGQLNVQGGKLTIYNSAGDWNGGSVSLSSNANLSFGFGLPSGSVGVNGAGLITAVGGDMAGDLTLNFATNSAITIDGFHPYDMNHDLTFNGPVTLKDVYLAGDGLITFQGASTLDLRSNTGPISSTLSANIRNEGITTLLGGTDIKGIGGGPSLTNTTGYTLTLVDRVGLYGNTLLYNAGDAIIRQQGSGTSQIDWAFDNAGVIAIDAATLQLTAARHWSGNVSFTNGGTLRLQTTTPDGFTTVSGNGSGTVEMVNTPVTRDFTLSYYSPGYTHTFLDTVSVAENTTLKIDGPTRLWGTSIGYSGNPSLFDTAALELKGGVILAMDTPQPRFVINVPVRSTGVVELDNSITSKIEMAGNAEWSNPATGTLRKTGTGLLSISGNFINTGTVEVEAGTLNLASEGDATWSDGIAIISSGATLSLPVVPTGAALFTGQGKLTLGKGVGYGVPLSFTNPLTLPISPSSRLTLANSRLTGESSFNVTRPLDFVGDEFVFSGGINLTADTHWGPRLGTPTVVQQTPVVGTVLNHTHATVRGTLNAGLAAFSQYDYARATQPPIWENLAGSTFTVGGPSGLTNAVNFDADAGYLANRSYGFFGTFNNRLGATFIAGIGGATVDWIFNSLYGTVRILNDERLTVTQAGAWDGTTVEQFQSYLNFRNTLPTGDFTVTGAGDVGFGAQSVDDIFTLDGVSVPLAGTTIRFTGLDHGLYGNLTGPGRLSLYGDHLGLAAIYSSSDAANFAATSPIWSNEGGVAVYGNLILDGSDIRPGGKHISWTLENTVDVYGKVLLHRTTADADDQDGFNVKPGGELTLSSVDLHTVTEIGLGLLEISPGGRLSTIGTNLCELDTENHGLITVTNDLTVFGLDWSGGVLTFAGGDHDVVHIRYPPAGKPLFQGKGTVSFDYDEYVISLDDLAYAFTPDFNGRPSVVFGNVQFYVGNSHLRLEGAADLTGDLILPTYGFAIANNTLDLAGQFILRDPTDVGGAYQLNVPRVRNTGAVETEGGDSILSSLNTSVSGFIWENAEGSTFALRNGVDLTLYGPPTTVHARFVNEAGATFRTSTGAWEDNVVNWDFANYGFIDVSTGTLQFAGSFTNFPGSTVHLYPGTAIDFGPHSTVTLDSQFSGSGSFSGNALVITGTFSPTTAGSVSLTGNSITLQNNATIDVGSAALEISGSLNGLGTIHAGNVTLGSDFTSTGTTVLTFNSDVQVLSGVEADFGSGSSIAITGTLGGSGTLEAGQILLTGTINPGSSPGTLNLVGNTTFSASSVFNFELGVSAKDLIAVTGNLTLDGTLNLTALNDLVTGRYTLFTYTGTLTDHALLMGTLGSRIQSASLVIDTANHVVAIDVVVNPVAGPRLSIQKVNGALQITFSNADGNNYTVLSSTNVSLPVAEWSVVGPATSLGGNMYQITAPIAPSEQRRFYQLRRAAP